MSASWADVAEEETEDEVIVDTKNERVEIAVGQSRMGAYVARPDDDAVRPGVLLFMEIFGVNGHIRSVADRIAAEGYVVLVPDLFHRTAPGIELDYNQASLERGIELMSAVRADQLLADLNAAHRTLKDRGDVGGRGIGAIGFCFGGHAAYLASAELPLAATASFYGGGVAGGPLAGAQQSTLARTPGISGRVLCIFGENDGYIPPSDVDAVRQALDAASVKHEVVVYPGVGHGFFCDVRDDYDQSAADDAWTRVKTLFAEELV